jgi:CHASE2 domain-containing sensor protein
VSVLLTMSFVSLFASSLLLASFYWTELRAFRELGFLGLIIGPVLLLLSCWELLRYQGRWIRIITAAIISFAATVVSWGAIVLYVTGHFH